MGVSVSTSSAQNSQRIEKRDERKKKQKDLSCVKGNIIVLDFRFAPLIRLISNV